MNEYHKIQTVFKRDPETKFKTLLGGEYSLPEFEFLKNNKWIWTEKVNGTNIRIIFDGQLITFGGKTDRAQIPADLVNRLNEKFLPLFPDFRNIFKCSMEGHIEVCLYGEGYGPKIQKGGGNYRTNQDFVLFDIKIGDWWLQRVDIEDIAQKLNIDIVPIIGVGTLPDMVQKVRNGFDSTWSTLKTVFKAEGVVARPDIELKTRSGHRIITKIKHKDF